MSGAAVCAAIATVSPLQAAIVGFAGQALHAWEQRHTDLVPTNLGQAFWGALGASIRILGMQLGAPPPIAIALALVAAILANVLSTGIALSALHAVPTVAIVRRIVTPALVGAYGYFVIAAALAATMLNGSLQGILRASGLFALAIAVGDSIGGRSIRAFLERQLLAAEPHVQYSQLAQGTFHDLRNLVGAAIVNLQAVDGESALPEREKSIAAAVAALQDANHLLLSAQASGRMSGRSEFGKVDLGELCAYVGAVYRPVASAKRVSLTTHIPKSEAAVFGHPVLLGEVLANLITNAIEATPEGGTVNVQCVASPYGSTVDVADTGGGISAAIRDRIFEPGFTTKGLAGTGLGLYTALGIARQHHGDLSYVGTSDQRGPTFRLSLPPFAEGRRVLGVVATEEHRD